VICNGKAKNVNKIDNEEVSFAAGLVKKWEAIMFTKQFTVQLKCVNFTQ